MDDAGRFRGLPFIGAAPEAMQSTPDQS
jgi:hypothetical protein